MPFENMSKLSWIYDLYRMGQSSDLREDPVRVQHEILDHIVKGMDADTGSIALHEGGEDDYILRAGFGIPAHAIGSRIKRGQGVIGYVIEHGEPVLLKGDIRDDPRFAHLASGNRSATPASSICWPLKQDKTVIGALSINRKGDHPPFTEADLEHGGVMVNVITIVIENARLHMQQQGRINTLFELNKKLEDMNRQLGEAQSQLLQSEKMASIGQLAAGVAHEINNPIGYVFSNLGTLQSYLDSLFEVIASYERAEPLLTGQPMLAEIQSVKQKADLSYLREDAASLMAETRDGITRVKKIVQDLKNFSHADTSDEWVPADLRQCLDSTLNIVWNELKYKTEIRKEYGDIPDVECLPSQLNQVFMNLMVNASHAIVERGTITLRTGIEPEVGEVWVEVADSGCGIAEENLKRIFDPFFTTKPVGTGTGLGLSLSYGIVQKHRGRIEVSSVVGQGTTFRVTVPVKHPIDPETLEATEAAA